MFTPAKGRSLTNSLDEGQKALPDADAAAASLQPLIPKRVHTSCAHIASVVAAMPCAIRELCQPFNQLGMFLSAACALASHQHLLLCNNGPVMILLVLCCGVVCICLRGREGAAVVAESCPHLHSQHDIGSTAWQLDLGAVP